MFCTKLGVAALTRAIEEALERIIGRPIATTLGTGEQMKAVVAANPFANVATNPAYLCVTFLSRAPTRSEIAPLVPLRGVVTTRNWKTVLKLPEML